MMIYENKNEKRKKKNFYKSLIIYLNHHTLKNPESIYMYVFFYLVYSDSVGANQNTFKQQQQQQQILEFIGKQNE